MDDLAYYSKGTVAWDGAKFLRDWSVLVLLKVKIFLLRILTFYSVLREYAFKSNNRIRRMRRNYLKVRILLNKPTDKTWAYHGEFDKNKIKISIVAHLPRQYRMSKKPSYAIVSLTMTTWQKKCDNLWPMAALVWQRCQEISTQWQGSYDQPGN